MGITNLLPLLKDAGVQVKVSDFKNATVAVDAYCWLHKGIFACADKLAFGDDSDVYVKYCMKYVNMLLSFKIKVIMVFDGRRLPAKEGTEEDRKKKRDSHKKKATELLILDRSTEAYNHLRQSIDVTHKMALNVMKACRSVGVDCIVAPFEADAQLAYLNIAGYADYVITEDSDLLVFGSKKTLYKLDMNGTCILIDKEKIPKALNIPARKYSEAKFRYMCILAGSDYWEGLKKFGLKKAREFVFFEVEDSDQSTFRRSSVFRRACNEDPEFFNKFHLTSLMFEFQPVFDPARKEVVPLNSALKDDDLKEILYNKLSLKKLELPPEQAYQLALGNLDPFTLEPMDDWSPNEIKDEYANKSIWSKEYIKPADRLTPATDQPPPQVSVFQKLTPVASSSLASPVAIKKSPLKPIESPRNIPDTPEKLAGKRKISGEEEMLHLYSQPESKLRPTDSLISSDYSSELESPRPTKCFKSQLSKYAFGNSRNPFAKSPAKGKSPDLSGGSLKSGLSQILKRGENSVAGKSPELRDGSLKSALSQILKRGENSVASPDLRDGSLKSGQTEIIKKEESSPAEKSPDLSGGSLKSGMKQILNPFAKSPAVGKSPDLSDRSLKSGLSQIIKKENSSGAGKSPDLSGGSLNSGMKQILKSGESPVKGKSPDLSNRSLKCGIKQSLNPFAKSSVAGKSPDLSDRSLKSGLTQILKSGKGRSEKKVVQRIISPFFVRFIQEKSPSPRPSNPLSAQATSVETGASTSVLETDLSPATNENSSQKEVNML